MPLYRIASVRRRSVKTAPIKWHADILFDESFPKVVPSLLAAPHSVLLVAPAVTDRELTAFIGPSPEVAKGRVSTTKAANECRQLDNEFTFVHLDGGSSSNDTSTGLGGNAGLGCNFAAACNCSPLQKAIIFATNSWLAPPRSILTSYRLWSFCPRQ